MNFMHNLILVRLVLAYVLVLAVSFVAWFRGWFPFGGDDWADWDEDDTRFPLTRALRVSTDGVAQIGYVITWVWALLLVAVWSLPALGVALALCLVLLVVGFWATDVRLLVPFVALAVAHRFREFWPDADELVETTIGLRPVVLDDNGKPRPRDFDAACEPIPRELGVGWRLVFHCAMAGVTTAMVENKAADALAPMNAVVCKVAQRDPATWLLDYYTSAALDPLDDVVTLRVLPELLHGRVLAYGRDREGTALTMDWGGISGIAISGMPGTGKTALANLIAAAALTSRNVKTAIIDGKGASDWGWAAKSAWLWTRSQNLPALADLLERLHDDMVRDLREHPWSETDPNFWHSEPTPEYPVHLVMIDECQYLFDPTGLTDKDDKQGVDRCRRYVADMVKRGRSAGWVTIVMTQKTTADAIPTNIRDNCALRLSFAVATPEAARAALGPLPDGSPSPVNIPITRPGGLVAAQDGRGLVEGRADYLPIELLVRVFPQVYRAEGLDELDACGA